MNPYLLSLGLILMAVSGVAQINNDACVDAVELDSFAYPTTMPCYNGAIYDSLTYVGLFSQGFVSQKAEAPYKKAAACQGFASTPQLGWGDIWFKFQPGGTNAAYFFHFDAAVDTLALTFWGYNGCDSLQAQCCFLFSDVTGAGISEDISCQGGAACATDWVYIQVSSPDSIPGFGFCGGIDTAFNEPTCIPSESTCMQFTSTAMHPSSTTTANGQIAPVIKWGVGPFTYLWSDGSQDSARTGLDTGTYVVTITSAAGCEVVDTITLTAPSSITEWMLKQEVSIFPTPTDGMLQLKLAKPEAWTSIRMFDQLGREVFRMQGRPSGMNVLNPKIKAGNYYFELEHHTGVRVRKQVIVL